MSDQVIVVLTTFPDEAGAERMANALVQAGLAACVNILPAMTSIYGWKEKIERGKEHQLVIKSSPARYAALEAFIQREHPYELPEILAFAAQDGFPPYIEWVNACTEN